MIGINLSGAEFGKGNIYGRDYAYPGPADLSFYTAHGIDLVRLPVKWERLQPVLGGPLDSTEVGRLQTFLTQADVAGARVIVDLHDYGRYAGAVLGSDALPAGALGDLWGQLALAIGKAPALAGYDLMNEPHDMGSATAWPNAAQAAIDAIRRVDGTTAIYIEGDNWASADSWARSNKALVLHDPSDNLVYEAHVYFDRYGAGTYSESYDAQGANPLLGVQRLQSFETWLTANHAHGFIGEVAVPKGDARWLPVLDNFLAAADSYGIDVAYWGGGSRWGSYPLSPRAADGSAAPQLAVLDHYAQPPGSVILGGGAGGDRLIGGRGGDTLSGGPGDDVLRGRAGADRLDGGPGIDTANYQSSPRAIDVDLQRAVQHGGDAEGDRLSGIEAIHGTGFADVLRGDAGANTLYGHSGDDMLEGRGGGDLIDGGWGRDTAVYAGAVTIDLTLAVQANGDRLVSIENLTGSGFADRLFGDAARNTLSGGAGDDWLEGRGGGDTLDGGTGQDTASYAGASAGVTASLATGLGSGGDRLIGIENLAGSAFADTLRGDDGANVLSGGGGDDRIVGGGGADVLNGGAGADRFVYASLADSPAVTPDQILDFATGDRIDLSALDGNALRSGNQPLTFIGTAAFSAPGQLHVLSVGGDWRVEANVDGNLAADFAILLHQSAMPVAGDFVL